MIQTLVKNRNYVLYNLAIHVLLVKSFLLFTFGISKQAKFVSLLPKLVTVLAPVSYRSSRRRRQRKRLLLKVPINHLRTASCTTMDDAC